MIGAIYMMYPSICLSLPLSIYQVEAFWKVSLTDILSFFPTSLCLVSFALCACTQNTHNSIYFNGLLTPTAPLYPFVFSLLCVCSPHPSVRPPSLGCTRSISRYRASHIRPFIFCFVCLRDVINFCLYIGVLLSWVPFTFRPYAFGALSP